MATLSFRRRIAHEQPYTSENPRSSQVFGRSRGGRASHAPSRRAKLPVSADAPAEHQAWQRQGERAANAQRALRREVTTHPACEIATDREPESHPVVGAREPGIHLYEWLEH